MKRLINSFLISISILTLLGISAIVKAQQTNELATKSAQKTVQKTVEYFLPYPGILPGNFLYPVKMLRDNIISFFIRDSIKKAEFFLLMADKRINAGKFLIDYGKTTLGEPTISKGQNYLDKALDVVNEAQNQGKDVKELLERLEKASQKHEEVLQEILQKVPQTAKPGIRNAIERSKKAQERIQKFLGKKTK